MQLEFLSVCNANIHFASLTQLISDPPVIMAYRSCLLRIRLIVTLSSDVILVLNRQVFDTRRSRFLL